MKKSTTDSDKKCLAFNNEKWKKRLGKVGSGKMLAWFISFLCTMNGAEQLCDE
jgi:hypothetical protein